MSNNINSRKNPNRGPLILIAVLLVIAVLVLLFRGCNSSPLNKETDTSDTQNPGIVYDSGTVVGGWDEADVDKIVDSLNEKVEEGMINISMTGFGNPAHNFVSLDYAAVVTPLSGAVSVATVANIVIVVEWDTVS